MSNKLLKEEKDRILELMGFAYKDNSHEVLSEQNIRKSLKEQQQQTTTRRVGRDIETTTDTTQNITLPDDTFVSGQATIDNVDTEALDTAIGQINAFIANNPGGTFVINIAGMESQVPNNDPYDNPTTANPFPLALARANTVRDYITSRVTAGAPVTYNPTASQGGTAWVEGGNAGAPVYTREQKVDVNIALADQQTSTRRLPSNFYIETPIGQMGKDKIYYIPIKPDKIWGGGTRHNQNNDFDRAAAQALANKNITDRKVIVGPNDKAKGTQSENYFGLNKPYLEVKGYEERTNDKHNKGIVKFWFEDFDAWNKEKKNLANYLALSGEIKNQANTKGAAGFATDRVPALPEDPEIAYGVRSSAPLVP